MNRRELQELRELTEAELMSRLNEAHQEHFNLRFQQTTRQLANTSRLKHVRKLIATIKTLQTERALGIR